MPDPWPAIEILASEILTKSTNLFYLFLTQAVIAARWPTWSFLCMQSLILVKDTGA